MNALERSLAYAPTIEDLTFVRSLPEHHLPTFSVVIPSYNHAAFLPETIESVVAQKYPRVDIFVVDGGSTDCTRDVLDAYVARLAGIFRYVSEPDRGQYHAVNKGIDGTDGDIVAWINSDDVYLPDAFWKVAAFFHFNRCALVVYGRNRYTDEQLRPKMEYPVDWSPVLWEQRRRMMHFCLPPQPSLFFRRVATKLCGKLASPILDYELWLRWQRYLPFFFIDDYLSLSRLHAEAKTLKERGQLINGICEVVHRYYGTVPFSWALNRAYHEAFGAAWTRENPPTVTRGVRYRAVGYWLLYNLRWLPRALVDAIRRARRFARESFHGRV